MSDSYDLVVIGAGPGGYVAALHGARLGLKVACVEKERLGGVCLNVGCIPSKALLKSAEYAQTARHLEDWGIKVGKVEVDFPAIVKRSRDVADKSEKGVQFLFKKHGVKSVPGTATLVAPGKIRVTGSTEREIQAKHIIVATGARARWFPGMEPDGERIMTYREAIVSETCPKSIVILGAGAIGLEFAYFYNAMGTSVTVIEMLDRIVPVEDEEVSKEALKLFKKQGIQFKPGHVTNSIEKTDSGVTVTIADVNDESKTETLDGDAVLVAVGVAGRFDGLFADDLHVEIDRGHIKVAYQDVDEPTYETSVPGVYAIGDVIGPPWLAHVSSEEAVTCVERLAGHHTLGVDYAAIPGCTYTSPQIASVGLTEAAAREAGHDVKIGKYPLTALGKAIATGAAEGFVKVVASEPYGEILGAHIIGKDASELIHEFCLAIRLEATAEDIISTMHAHPTMAEALHEAALGVEGRVLNA